MKKVLLSLGFVGMMLSSTSTNAQSFDLEVTADTLKVAVTKANFDIYNKITNKNASNIKLDWRVINHDFPASWGDAAKLGMCDNLSCRTNVNNQLLDGTTHTSIDYAPNIEGDWHFQLIDFLSVTPGTHYATIEYKENGGTYADTTTFVLTVFATDIQSSVSKEDYIVLYPNPATDKLNVSFGENSRADKITIHNFVGKEVLSKKVVDKTMSINIKQIPAGMYYIRVADANGRVFGTKRFTHR